MEKNEAMKPNHELVVLLHGIFRTKRCMKKLEKHLNKLGYQTLNLNYPSTRLDLLELAKIVNTEIEPLVQKANKIHFVGYSMGGLLVRVLLNHFRYDQVGRVVLLAPPNHGSEVADLLRNNPLFKRFYGPAGQQLTTQNDTVQSLMGPVNYPVGILAGTRTIDPISSWFIKGLNDGKVSVESTKLTGMQDHLCIPSSHTFFPQHPIVIQQTCHFLAFGCFSHSKQP